jgi:hypothetical protein
MSNAQARGCPISRALFAREVGVFVSRLGTLRPTNYEGKVSLRLHNARMESSSMLETVYTETDSEMVWKGFKVSKASSFKAIETLKLCHFETLSFLLADAELADHGLVALGIVFLEVVEQAAALADQHEKPAARAVVFLVRLEVLRQLADAFAKQGDLNFGTSGVALVRTVAVNEGFLLLSG